MAVTIGRAFFFYEYRTESRPIAFPLIMALAILISCLPNLNKPVGQLVFYSTLRRNEPAPFLEPEIGLFPSDHTGIPITNTACALAGCAPHIQDFIDGVFA
jgi:hypothetical protein